MGEARWVRKDYPTIMSGLVVRYFWRDRMPVGLDDPEINASRDGVSIQGSWPTMGPEEIAELIHIANTAALQCVAIAASGRPRSDDIERDDRKGVFG